MPVFDLGNFGEESDTDDDGESDSREGVSQPVKSLRGCSGNRQVLWLYQEGVRSGRSEGEEDAAATSTLAASRSPCIDTIHKYSMCLKYNLGIFAPDHSEHEI